MQQGAGVEDHPQAPHCSQDVVLGSAVNTAAEQDFAVAESAQIFQHGECAGKRQVLVCADAASGGAARRLWCAGSAAHGTDGFDHIADISAGERGGAASATRRSA